MKLDVQDSPGGASTMVSRLDHLARDFGDRPALADGCSSTVITFAEMAAQAHLTAEELRRIGVPENGVIAMVSDRSARAAALFLSLSCYAAVAPVPATATRDEATVLLSDLRPAALISNTAGDTVADAAASLGIPVLDVRSKQGAVFGLAPRQPVAVGSYAGTRVLPDKGLILATSGTTGRPKLVPHTQAQLIEGARNVAKSLRLTPADSGVEVMPLHHVHGLVAGILAPYIHGAQTVISPTPDPDTVLRLLAETGARWYTAAPTIHQSIVKCAGLNPGLAAQCRLRFVRSASSALPESVRTGLDRVFGAPVVEAYGMTEAGHQISSQTPEVPNRHGNLGVPPAGTVRIVETGGHPAPQGHSGNVLIKSSTLTYGYLDNPTANSKEFRDGWLVTGDLGVIDQSGALRLVGRNKEIIDRGGAQVAPAEIEDALLSLPGVSEAVGFAVAHPTLGQDAAAAVVLEDGCATTAPELRAELFGRLSDYKIPSRILIVQSLPKGPTGKLRRLDMETLLHDELSKPALAPATQLESILAALFAETLGNSDIGRETDFFAAGGDSLSGVRLVVQLNALFGTGIAPEGLFRHPTPAELAGFLVSTDDGAVADRLASLVDPDDPASEENRYGPRPEPATHIV